jgi:hypothetical protein
MTKMIAMVGGIELAVLLVAIGGTAFWVWALVDSGRRLGSGERGQLGWVIAIALGHFIGALAYLVFGRRKS